MMFALYRIVVALLVMTVSVLCISKLDGELVSIEDYPYVVSIQERGSHVCNGVIVSSKFILTSKNCLKGHISSITVLAGTDDLSAHHEGVRVGALHLHIHQIEEYDVALIELRDGLNFTQTISSVRLPMPSTTLHQYTPDEGELIGFGHFGNSTYKDRLRVFPVSLVSGKTCSDENEMRFCGVNILEIKTFTVTSNIVLQTKLGELEFRGNSLVKSDANGPVGGIHSSMDEFAMGSPFVSNGVIYGVLSKRNGPVAVFTSIPHFTKYIKSTVYDIPF